MLEAVAPAAPFPPIGQGVNAALESTMTLDPYIGEAGRSPGQFLVAAVRYTAQWTPEADAVSWLNDKRLCGTTSWSPISSTEECARHDRATASRPTWRSPRRR